MTASIDQGRLGSVVAASATADVWYARATSTVGESTLSENELARAARFREAVSAARYISTRALVRRVLGQRLQVPPREVPILQTDLGKPFTSSGLHFNVSHSGDLILLAVCVEKAVGIDVERRRDVPRTTALIERWLTNAERDDVEARVRAGIPVSDAFLRVWSLKEARLKALGVGLAGAASVAGTEAIAVPLDDLLNRLPDSGSGVEYVGAVAFA